MTHLRTFMQHHWTLAVWLVVAALFVRAVVPTGYMVDANSATFSFTICSDASGDMVTHDVTIPSDGKGDTAKADSPCAFSGLAHAALSGADAPLLAMALVFILALGFAPIAALVLQRGDFLRPPPQGPPVTLSS